MRAYSLDLRTHLLQAVDAGTSKAEAARVFGVSVRTLDRYLRQRQQTGTVAAKPIPGRPRIIGTAQEAALDAQLTAHPDATLAEHCQRWAQTQGVRVSLPTMYRAIARRGWTWKKRRWWPPSATRPSGRPGGSRTRRSIRHSWSSSMRRVPTSR